MRSKDDKILNDENKPEVHGSRVWKWVQSFYSESNPDLDKVADNFMYYMENVDSFESGEFDFKNLPHYTPITKAIIHTSVKFGLAWAKDEELYIIMDGQGSNKKIFVAVVGSEENAEMISSQNESYYYEPATPTGRGVDQALEKLRNCETQELGQARDCFEYLHEELNETTEMKEQIVQNIPHFPYQVKWLLIYSVLFGRLWELSDPALAVVVDQEDEFVELTSDNKRAAELTENDEYRSAPITPIDNDRYEENSDMNSLNSCWKGD